MAERGPLLVNRLGLTLPGVSAGDLTVGSCDLLLIELRRRLFGPTIETVSTCPSCGTDVECHFDIDELWPHRPEPGDFHGTAAVVDIDIAGQRFRCRIPSNRDLAELARTDPSRRLASFAERCVLVGPDGKHPATDGQSENRGPNGTSAPALAEETIAALATALADLDEGAATLVELRCPCGATDIVEWDIRSFLWAELSAWAECTLTEVHELASAYGWPERDILDLSPRRRSAYLERCR